MKRPLTASEYHVLDLLAHGSRCVEIAAQEGCAISTVQKHVQTIKFKLGAKNVTHAVVLALRQGLVPEGADEATAPKLTPRQVHLLALVAHDWDYTAIAARQRCAINQIKREMHAIYRLLGVRSAAGAVQRCRDLSLTLAAPPPQRKGAPR